MLFNSYEYILVFLPFVFLTYFYLNGKRLGIVATGFLAAASLFFYSWWNPVYLPIILGSMLFNYVAGAALVRSSRLPPRTRKSLLIIGIGLNLGLLGFFKYSDFFIANLNAVSGGHVALLDLALPLAISFFTFTQVAILIDLSYCISIMFFM